MSIINIVGCIIGWLGFGIIGYGMTMGYFYGEFGELYKVKPELKKDHGVFLVLALTGPFLWLSVVIFLVMERKLFKHKMKFKAGLCDKKEAQ